MINSHPENLVCYASRIASQINDGDTTFSSMRTLFAEALFEYGKTHGEFTFVQILDWEKEDQLPAYLSLSTEELDSAYAAAQAFDAEVTLFANREFQKYALDFDQEAAKRIKDEFERVMRDLSSKGAFDSIRALLEDATWKSSERFRPEINFEFMVHDNIRKQRLSLSDAGILPASSGAAIRYEFAEITTFMVDNEKVSVPWYNCPNCWGTWPSKRHQTQCPECKITLGKRVWFLVSDNICPHCHEGHVDHTTPRCTRCKIKAFPGNYFRWEE